MFMTDQARCDEAMGALIRVRSSGAGTAALLDIEEMAAETGSGIRISLCLPPAPTPG